MEEGSVVRREASELFFLVKIENCQAVRGSRENNLLSELA